jgi:hypothetical protein
VQKEPVAPCFTDKALEDVGHNNKKVRGKRVPLPETIPTADPIARDPIEKDRTMTCNQDTFHPSAPEVVKPPSPENGKEALPVDKVESFPKINFEHHGRRLPSVATPHKIGSVNDVPRDTPAGEKTGLVRVHKGMDGSLESRG